MKELKLAIGSFATDLRRLEALPTGIRQLQRQLASPPNLGREWHRPPTASGDMHASLHACPSSWSDYRRMGP